MKEHPILFNGEMVRAVLDGRKKQTRRPVTPEWSPDVTEVSMMPLIDPILKCMISGDSGKWQDDHGLDEIRRCPFGVVGDHLWVRETWRPFIIDGPFAGIEYCCDREHRAVGACESFYPDWSKWFEKSKGKWHPSIHMPRWASRITLKVLFIRVQRVQDITEADALAEGIDLLGMAHHGTEARYAFAKLWTECYPKMPWEANPWVWTVEFRRITA